MKFLVLITLFVATARMHAQTSEVEENGASRTALVPLETVPTVLEGSVLTSEGLPAEGAVVVSSAGGRAVTRTNGWFRLEVELPRDARSVQLTVHDSGPSPTSVS